mgnify:CR=1 FL=1
MEQDAQLQIQGGPEPVRDPHRSLHSETGARPGEHSGRSGNPRSDRICQAMGSTATPRLKAAARRRFLRPVFLPRCGPAA